MKSFSLKLVIWEEVDGLVKSVGITLSGDMTCFYAGKQQLQQERKRSCSKHEDSEKSPFLNLFALPWVA